VMWVCVGENLHLFENLKWPTKHLPSHQPHTVRSRPNRSKIIHFSMSEIFY
jgi:hypothetical protein